MSVGPDHDVVPLRTPRGGDHRPPVGALADRGDGLSPQIPHRTRTRARA
ncbi:hypothetical protein ACLQ2J_18720 [Streptomyces cyaneofuscatus]